jgi:hypothetical protein
MAATAAEPQQQRFLLRCSNAFPAIFYRPVEQAEEWLRKLLVCCPWDVDPHIAAPYKPDCFNRLYNFRRILNEYRATPHRRRGWQQAEWLIGGRLRIRNPRAPDTPT